MTDKKGQKPLFTKRIAGTGIKLSGWENVYRDKQGNERTFISLQLTRSFKDKENLWKEYSIKGLGTKHLRGIIEACEFAISKLKELEKKQ